MPSSADAPLPRLHVLASERELAGAEGRSRVASLFDEAGPIAVHIRARGSARRIYEWAASLAERARRSGGWCAVNGRPDIALAAGAHAVQLGRGALGVEDARAVAVASAGRLRIGASVHAPDEAARAVAAGADYLVLGTIYPTASHPGRPGSGPVAVTAAVAALPREVPLLAIGGIGADRAPDVLAAGAYGIVVASAVWNDADPARAAAALSRRVTEWVRTERDG